MIADGDMDIIRQPVDFLGVNYYSPVYLRAGDPDDLRSGEELARCGLPGVVASNIVVERAGATGGVQRFAPAVELA